MGKTWFKENRKPVLLCGILLLLSVLCFSVCGAMASVLREPKAAEKWAGESDIKFAYYSVCFPETEKASEETVYMTERALEKKLTEASVEAPAGGSLWRDGYCGTAMVTAETERGSATVKAIGVGGDFFFFHEPNLRCGNLLSQSDLMHDRVVLEKELAWTLFGATDVAGMELTVGGKPFLVAGVIEKETDFAHKAAAEENTGLYLWYDALAGIADVGITSYDLVLPDPVTNFAENFMVEAFEGKSAAVTNVSSRYSVKNLFDILLSFGKRSMRTDNIIFPIWENAARLTEDYAALSFLLGTLFLLVPLGFGVFLAAKEGKKYGKKGFAFLKGKFEAAADAANDRLYEKERRKKLPPKEE